MEVCVYRNSVSQPFIQLKFLFKQVVWKSNQLIHFPIQCLTILAQYAEIHSISLPLFRFALFQWIKHGISECKHFGCAWYNTVSVVYSIKITHTLAHIIQAAKFLKTTEQYRLTELVCIVSTRTLHVIIFRGCFVSCHSFHCCNFVNILSIFLLLAFNALVHYVVQTDILPVLLTWNAQFTNVCVRSWQVWDSRVRTYHWTCTHFFMVFIISF